MHKRKHGSPESIEKYRPKRREQRKIRLQKLKDAGTPEHHRGLTGDMLEQHLEAKRKRRRELHSINSDRNNLLQRQRKAKLRALRANGPRNKADELSRMAEICRKRLYRALRFKRMSKNGSTEKMLGCSFEFLRSHLESQFTKGMTWANQGDWHIDHIIPFSSAKTEEELLHYAHFSNLRPLWAFENLSKKDKIVDCQPELLLQH